MNEQSEGCEKCTGQTECIVSVSSPRLWLKIKIEQDQMLVTFDAKPNQGLRTVVPIKYCPFCGKELKP